jgi:hypothetical protein
LAYVHFSAFKIGFVFHKKCFGFPASFFPKLTSIINLSKSPLGYLAKADSIVSQLLVKVKEEIEKDHRGERDQNNSKNICHRGHRGHRVKMRTQDTTLGIN